MFWCVFMPDCAISARWDRPHPTDCNLHVIVFILILNNICVCVDLHFGVVCLKCVDCQTQIDMAAANLKFAKLWLTRVLQLPNSGLAAATLWFTRVWQLPNSGKCQTRVLVMKSFLRWCYCVNILDTFHFALCWFCLVLFCSILSKRFDLSCVLFPYKLHTPSHQATLSIIRQKYS